MIFGQVPNPGEVDFTLPADSPETSRVLSKSKQEDEFEVYIGCAKWNRTDLKGFYPRGTKDELAYYATQFNSVELNATFYGMPTWDQIETWKNKTPDHFKFFPKLTNTISHYKRLIDVKEPVDTFCNAVSNFGDKLGMCFLQLHDNFKPKDFARLEKTLREFPKGVPLGLEVRNSEWFADSKAKSDYENLLEELGMANIIVDTAGRRDMIHMRLTSPVAFVRYVGANHASDYTRLDDWAQRLLEWKQQGLQKIYFFLHQNIELESPLLSEHLTKEVNKIFGLDLVIPVRQPAQKSLLDEE